MQRDVHLRHIQKDIHQGLVSAGKTPTMSSSTEIQADLRDKFTALEGLFSKVDRLKNEVEKKACLDNISKDIEECKR